MKPLRYIGNFLINLPECIGWPLVGAFAMGITLAVLMALEPKDPPKKNTEKDSDPIGFPFSGQDQ